MQAATETIAQAAAALDDSTQGHSFDATGQAVGAVATATQAPDATAASTSCDKAQRGGVTCGRCVLRDQINDMVIQAIVAVVVSGGLFFFVIKVVDLFIGYRPYTMR